MVREHRLALVLLLAGVAFLAILVVALRQTIPAGPIQGPLLKPSSYECFDERWGFSNDLRLIALPHKAQFQMEIGEQGVERFRGWLDKHGVCRLALLEQTLLLAGAITTQGHSDSSQSTVISYPQPNCLGVATCSSWNFHSNETVVIGCGSRTTLRFRDGAVYHGGEALVYVKALSADTHRKGRIQYTWRPNSVRSYLQAQ